jgi:exonuclease III
LEEFNPDIALLQEVSAIPEDILIRYDCRFERACSKQGTPQKFGTALLVRGEIGEAQELTSEWDWVNREIDRFRGNLLAYEITTELGRNVRALSVYCPAWPIDRDRLAGIKTSVIKLENNPDVWVTELLWAALRHAGTGGTPWIVGGDLNSSVTFDHMWGNEPRGNQEIQDRMASLGMTECLLACQGQLTPTFRNPKGGEIIHQMDHLFVSGSLRDHVESCVVGDAQRVFGGGLSDHLPVIADFTA